MAVTLSILQAYYPVVSGLHQYLQNHVCFEDGSSILRSDDPPSFTALLRGSHVVPEAPLTDRRKINAKPPMVHLHEVIDKAQERLLSKGKGRSTNIIASGYRQARHNGEVGRVGTRVHLVNYFINTNVTTIQSSEWRMLFERIGEDVMFHLLTETSIFIPLPNDCLCQVTGEPIIHLKAPPFVSGIHGAQFSALSKSKAGSLKRKAVSPQLDERPRKRMKADSATRLDSTSSAKRRAATTLVKRATADIVIPRSRLFYSWPYLVPKNSTIVIGLPPKHVLNVISPSYYSHRITTADCRGGLDPKELEAHVRHLAKYVFPRQYGLSHPFVENERASFQSHKSLDYLDRESEIKRAGAQKTPKRVKAALHILDQMIWKHRKCRYKALLELVCPSKIKAEDKSTLDSSIILEMMSEQSIQLRSQPSFREVNVSTDSAGRPITPHGLSQARRHFKYKPRFAEFACSHAEVYRFVTSVTDAVIPRIMWGCRKNRRLINEHVKTFITSRRYETTTLHNILQGFSVTECDWLAPDNAQLRVSRTDAIKRRELLEEFLFWYFDSFLIPLLRTTFYVTESSAFRRRVLYFRQDDWSALCTPLVERLSSETFQRIEQREAEEILRQRKLGFSFVRLLPKETGVRPIVNLRKRKVSTKDGKDRPQPSINQILQAAFQILTYEKENQPQLLGASVFGSNEVYTKLKAYKSRLLEHGTDGKLPKLYFVKVDVQACFDTIEQSKLLEILKDAISEDGYLIQRYGQVNCVGSRVRRKYAKKAQPEDDHPHFLDFAAKLAAALRHTIFVDQVVYPFAQKQDIMALLEEHITENIVKIGDCYYRQMVGIPQGSVLSTLLCSFFYGDLERKHFKFTDDVHSLLLRLVDDYLFLTTDLLRARRFLGMMIQGHPEYGCFISKEKTLTNFDYDPDINITDPQQKSFPWCGFMINMTDLSVSADYTRYHETYLQDSLTVERGRRPGVTFVHKMMQLTKAKSHILFTDVGLNSRHTVHLNIYQNFLLSAMKMHYYLRSWGSRVMKNVAFLRNTIQQMIRYTFATMRNKSSNKVAKASSGRCDLQQDQVVWLGTHAFHTVLSRKPKIYCQLIKWLQLELSRPRNRRLRKSFRGIVKDGLTTLSLLSF